MVDRPHGRQFHFDPATYLETIRTEVPAYDELQDAVAEATVGITAERVLELGVGTGETSRRVLELHPEAELIGIDESAEILAAASTHPAGADPCRRPAPARRKVRPRGRRATLRSGRCRNTNRWRV